MCEGGEPLTAAHRATAVPTAALPSPQRSVHALMELSAIGEQVFAVESIRKKRVRKVGSAAGSGETPPSPKTPPPHGTDPFPQPSRR